MINLSDIQFTEESPHIFLTEASLISLRPGNWPNMLECLNGNGRPLIKRREVRDGDGDVLYVVYKQEFGAIQLTVFND